MPGYGYTIEVLRPGSSYQRGEVRYEGRADKRAAAIKAAREELLATTPLEEVTDAIELAPPRPVRARSIARNVVARKTSTRKASRARGRRSPTPR